MTVILNIFKFFFLESYISTFINGSIILLFIYYVYQLLKYYLKIREWKKCDFNTEYNGNLKDIFNDYDLTRVYRVNNTDKTEHFATDFMNLPTILKSISINIRTLNSAPGVLVGLGLLGTFGGLTYGISGFDTASADTINSGIQSLLSGMGSAFSTSLLGMLTSLILIIAEKRLTNETHRFCDSQCSRLDREFLISEIELSQYKAQELLKQLDFIDSETGNVILPGNILKKISKDLDTQSGGLKTLITDLSDSLNDSFNEVMSEQYEMLNNTLINLSNKMDELAKSIKQPADDMTKSIVEDLQKSMKTMVMEFRESISGEATSNMEGLAKNLDQAGKALLTFPEQLQAMTSNMKSNFSNIQSAIELQSQSNTNLSTLAIESMKSKMDESGETMSAVLSEVKEVISSITQNSSLVNTKLSETISQSLHKINNQTEESNQAINKHVQQQVEGMIKQFEKLNLDLNNKYAKINEFHSDISNDSLAVLEKYNRSIEGMVTANLQIQDTIQQFITVQKESEIINRGLMSVSERLKDGSDKLKEMQIGLCDKQDAYLDKYEDIITEVTTVLETTGTTMSDYSNKFETIQTGLSSIFGELNQGLNQYTQTVSTGTKEFLDSYTKSVNDTARALAGASNQQSELTENLIEAVENFKK